jgi:hypothetical protein
MKNENENERQNAYVCVSLALMYISLEIANLFFSMRTVISMFQTWSRVGTNGIRRFLLSTSKTVWSALYYCMLVEIVHVYIYYFETFIPCLGSSSNCSLPSPIFMTIVQDSGMIPLTRADTIAQICIFDPFSIQTIFQLRYILT